MPGPAREAAPERFTSICGKRNGIKKCFRTTMEESLSEAKTVWRESQNCGRLLRSSGESGEAHRLRCEKIAVLEEFLRQLVKSLYLREYRND
jgi:hypothetical protein